MLTFVIETATPALIFTKLATLALRLMSAWRLSTSSSILPTESWGTLSRTSGAVELSLPKGVVVTLLLAALLDVPVLFPALEFVVAVGGVVTTDVVPPPPFLGGEVAGGITPELDDAAITGEMLMSRMLRKRAKNVQRDAIAEK
jgi:hypothetical protein